MADFLHDKERDQGTAVAQPERQTVGPRPGMSARTDELATAQRAGRRRRERTTHGRPPRTMLQLRARVAAEAEARRASSPREVHAAAERATAGTAQKLPYVDQIQASFGEYDVTGIAAYLGGGTDGELDSMGAEGFARGDAVALRSGASLHTVAHEAAHVVQQRAGVSLSGGVGRAGDHYERHADAVADRVVAGKSAQELLGQMAGTGGSARSAVQRKGTSADAAKTADAQSGALAEFTERDSSTDKGKPATLDNAITDRVIVNLRRLFEVRIKAVETFSKQSVLPDLPPASAIRSLLLVVTQAALAAASAGLTLQLSGALLDRMKAAGYGPLARSKSMSSMVGAANGTVVKAGVEALFDVAVDGPTVRAHIAFADLQSTYLADERDRLLSERMTWLRERAAALEAKQPGLGMDFALDLAAALKTQSARARELQLQESLNGWLALLARASLGTTTKDGQKPSPRDGADVSKITDHSRVTTPREPTGRLAWESAKRPKGAHQTPGVLRLTLRASGPRKGSRWKTNWNAMPVKIQKATIAGINKELRQGLSGRPLATLPIPMTAWFVYDGGFKAYMIGRNEAGEYFADTNDPEFANFISNRAGKQLTPTEAARYIFEVELAKEKPKIGAH